MKMFKKVLCMLAISGMGGVSVNNLAAAGEDERAARGRVLLKLFAAQLPSGLILQVFDNANAVNSLASALGIERRSALYIIQSSALAAGLGSNALAGQITLAETTGLVKKIPMASLAGVIATRKWFNNALSFIPGYGKIFLCPSESCQGICMDCLIPRAIEFAGIYSMELYAQQEFWKWWNGKEGGSKRKAPRIVVDEEGSFLTT